MSGRDQTPVGIVLLERDGEYFFHEPGTTLIGSGDSVEHAYMRFMANRQDYVAASQRAGLSSGLEGGARTPPSLGNTYGRSRWSELGMFVAKAVIVLVVIAGSLAAALAPLANSVGGLGERMAMALRPVTGLSMNDVVDKSAIIAKDFRSLPDDRKEAFRRNLGEIAREIRPYVDAWREVEAATPSPPAPERK